MCKSNSFLEKILEPRMIYSYVQKSGYSIQKKQEKSRNQNLFMKWISIVSSTLISCGIYSKQFLTPIRLKNSNAKKYIRSAIYKILFSVLRKLKQKTCIKNGLKRYPPKMLKQQLTYAISTNFGLECLRSIVFSLQERIV